MIKRPRILTHILDRCGGRIFLLSQSHMKDPDHSAETSESASGMLVATAKYTCTLCTWI